MTSKIKVDNINKVSDDSNVINKCGSTVTVGSAPGNLRSGTNNLQASDGGNLISQSGTTITLGASGDTISLASGASQTGFGRTGTVDWCTTAKTSPFTATSGDGFFVDTSGGAVTVTLPSSPSGGDIVSIKDYAGTFCAACKAVTIGRGGSKINGLCVDATLDTKGDSITLIYVDNTRGWLNIQTDDTVEGSQFITATGGTITTVCTNFKVHTFTSDGTFCISAGAGALAKVDYMVVAGGGGGGGAGGPNWGGAGGGGAGGFRESVPSPAAYTASPLANPGNQISVSPGPMSVTVGAGGPAGSTPSPSAAAHKGSDSVFSTITSTGGGGGSGANTAINAGGPGGSGGGGYSTPTKGSGNTPSQTPPQGSDGGVGTYPSAPTYAHGGGGGATAAGGGDSGPNPGGCGATTNFSGSPVTLAGGGGSGVAQSSKSNGGPGGGGEGGRGSPCVAGTAGTANTGGGGGGAGSLNGFNGTAGAGGSGIVRIRYKFQ